MKSKHWKVKLNKLNKNSNVKVAIFYAKYWY